MKYSAIRHQLKTGDIALFSGNGLISTGIKVGTFSKYSHVGIILNFSEYGMVALMESTTLNNVKDLDTNRFLKGVQVVPLSERIARYDGEVFVRKLEDANLGKNELARLMAFRNEIKGRPYEENKIELINSAYDGPLGHNEEDLSSLFCSELVAEAYQRIGLLPESLSSNEFTPKNFSKKGNLRLLKGYLGKEIHVE